MTNRRMNGLRIEAWAAEGVEIRNQAGARRDLDLQIFFARDALVDTVPMRPRSPSGQCSQGRRIRECACR